VRPSIHRTIEIETTVPLDFHNRELVVTTFKKSRGNIMSSVRCVVRESPEVTIWEPHADYHVVLARAHVPRVTQKAMQIVHDEGISKINDAIDGARLYYTDGL
jgi:hypothetical protein